MRMRVGTLCLLLALKKKSNNKSGSIPRRPLLNQNNLLVGGIF